MIPERLAALRQEMEKRDIAVYIVPTADFHESEYVGEYFKARRFITGFTGSAGTAVITRTKAGLWTDGRYFVQAAKQLEGTTVTLYRMGEEHVPTVDEYVEQTLKEGGTIGFDGRVVNGRWGAKLQQIAEKKHGKLYVQEDLIGQIWKDRPPMSKEPVWILDEAYSGRSTKDKLAAVREKMKEKGAEVHLLASLYDIAWLLNVRGNDISYVPVVLSYLALTQEQCIWFLQEEVVDDTLREYLQKNGITTRPYEAFYEYVKTLENQTILLNRAVVNTKDKLAAVREKMKEKGAEVHLLASLYDIAWLLNVRGNDISYVPVVLSYLALTQEQCIWFLQEEVVDDTLREYLQKNGITTRPYEAFYEYVKTLENQTILLNRAVVNTKICNNLPESAQMIDAEDPTLEMKAVKNETEISNTRKAHVKDAVAMCRFMYWLKKNVGKIPMTEISASDYLESLRREQEGLLDLSFDTICGYADHGAIVHYAATPESDVPLKPEGLLPEDIIWKVRQILREHLHSDR